jgi:3-oxochol-4-en-24-oyl-CoA dehydrogenase
LLAITEEHHQLAASVRRWAADHAPPAAARAALDDPAADGVWTSLAAQGLLALHVPERWGGAGYGDLELAVVAEQLGRALVPGPVLATLHLSRLLVGSAGDALADKLLPGLASGQLRGAVALEPTLRASGDGEALRLEGTVRPVTSAAEADVLLVGARDDDGEEVWAVLDAADVTVTALPSYDGTRPVAEVTVAALQVPAERQLPALDGSAVRDAAVLLYAAESAGIAGWACDEATEHAKVREQFGRPIGQFQAVKHGCADLLVRAEQARAVAWDLAGVGGDPAQRELAVGVAAAVAIDAGVRSTLDAIQILGGIGFTFEHDAHLYLKRATATRQLLGGPDRWHAAVARAALSGARRRFELDLAEDDDARATRAEVRRILADLPEPGPERRRALVDAGLAVPHWPEPWGRDASPTEQIVIDEELQAADVRLPDLVIGGWILPTIVTYGTDEQRERFVRPTLLGEITWCQLFSEPGAGSDLAALSTRAVRVDGGWRLTGQKVWTSLAHTSDWGLCLARTDPDAAKHAGITAFLVDMRSDGLDVRPLRELTGRELFNEVFLEDVFVPDAMVCGPLGGGWKAARTTLANERVAMSSGSSMGAGVEGVLRALTGHPRRDDPVLRARVGALVCEGQVLGVLGFRTTLQKLHAAGGSRAGGAESSVRKLVGGEHNQRCAELTLELLGPEGAVWDDAGRSPGYQFLQSQCLTIAGGTTAVQRNVVAERLLGLPRDP